MKDRRLIQQEWTRQSKINHERRWGPTWRRSNTVAVNTCNKDPTYNPRVVLLDINKEPRTECEIHTLLPEGYNWTQLRHNIH